MAETTTRGTIPEDHRLPPARGGAVATPASRSGRAPAPSTRGVNGRRPLPSDPDELRREIEATRVRMSRTLDQIEGTLVRQKEEVVARVTLRDLRRRIATSPFRPLLIAFAAGYIVAAIRD